MDVIRNDSDNVPLSSVFNELRLQGKLCDAVIMVGDVKFPVHKIILCGCSEYFRNLFTQWSQLEEKEYEFPHMTPDIMQLIIEFVYVGSVLLTEQNVCELFRAADYFCVEGLLEACCQFLEQQLRPQNCIGIWQFIRKYYFPKLIHEAYLFILHHFGEVSASSGFLQLSLEELISIIEEDRLQVKQESIVFEAVLRWIAYSPEERGAHISQLLPKVRLALMTQDYFTNSVKNNELVMENNECQDIVRKAEVLITGLSDRLDFCCLYEGLAQPRLPSMILLAFGGTEGSEEIPANHIEAYDVGVDKWTYVTNPEQPTREYHGVVFLSGSVYCVGGWNELDSLSSVVRFDLETHTWHEVAPMHSSRGSVGVTVLNECIYAMGGSNGFDVHDTAEYYEPKTNQWTEIAHMHKKRNGVSSTTLHGKVYACGGSEEGEILSSAECYSPETNQWTLIAPMNSRRTDFGVVAYAGQVYAVGGFNGTSWLDSAEAYNPETNSWNILPSLPTPRSKFGISVIDERVYIVGGSNSTTISTSDVEFYDVKTGEWSQARNMGFRRMALSCCVVSGLRNMAEYSAPREPFPLLSDDSGNSSGEEDDEMG
ncbi:hypothetical protein LDENG_00094850 [Lucifuga dentata]|nr:hypothetical protein LDENG_00094850 [Lucifuga dentata]